MLKFECIFIRTDERCTCINCNRIVTHATCNNLLAHCQDQYVARLWYKENKPDVHDSILNEQTIIEESYGEYVYGNIINYFNRHHLHRIVSEEVVKERFEVCAEPCEKFTGNNCNICGCSPSKWYQALTDDRPRCPLGKFKR
jgi:hypothetical protein